MSQSLAKMWTHLIFSTKDRYPFLSGNDIRQQLHAYLSTILRNQDCPTLLVGGVADHVHALFLLSKNHSIAQIVYEVKRSSSKWIKTQGPEYKKFYWQNGYGAFQSVSLMLGRCSVTS
jgi:putative transposase